MGKKMFKYAWIAHDSNLIACARLWLKALDYVNLLSRCSRKLIQRNFIKEMNCKLHLYVTNLVLKLIPTLLITVIRVIPQHDFMSLENFSRDGNIVLKILFAYQLIDS
jgi:hypothetical protein